MWGWKKWLADQAAFPQKWAPCLLVAFCSGREGVVHQIKRISKETRLEWEWINTAAALGRPIKHTGRRITVFWPFLQYATDDTKAQRLNWFSTAGCRHASSLVLCSYIEFRKKFYISENSKDAQPFTVQQLLKALRGQAHSDCFFFLIPILVAPPSMSAELILEISSVMQWNGQLPEVPP